VRTLPLPSPLGPNSSADKVYGQRERVPFRRHDAISGHTYNAVYNTAIVLWAFLAQVLSDGKMRGCAAAVARVGDFLIAMGKSPPSTDPGESNPAC
jgi:putative transposase